MWGRCPAFSMTSSRPLGQRPSPLLFVVGLGCVATYGLLRGYADVCGVVLSGEPLGLVPDVAVHPVDLDVTSLIPLT